MKFKPTCRRSRCADRAQAGFTLVEVLAALLFMAIVIPVAVEGVRVANQAGVVGERKSVSAQVADRVINELVATGQATQGVRNGVIRQGDQEYPWTSRIEAWNQGTLSLFTVTVGYVVQGQDYEVRLSTLIDAGLQ